MKKSPLLFVVGPIVVVFGAIGLTILVGSDPPPVEADSVPIDAYRSELLELAFESASSMPLEPHVKNRSRAQAEVVQAALEMGQGRTALRFADAIANWERGTSLADVAYYAIENGHRDLAPELLKRAEQVAKKGDNQEWRIDRIRVRMARAYALLGDSEKVVEIDASIRDPSEVGKVAISQAKVLDEADFEEAVKQLDEALQLPNFDRGHTALKTCVALFRRFYDDEEKRDRMEERVKTGWPKLPRPARVGLLIRLVETAAENDDRKKAAELAREVRHLSEFKMKLTEQKIPRMAKVAKCLSLAGDDEGARKICDDALALFEKKGHNVTDVFRSETLLPLAEAYRSLGDEAKALEVYRRAVQEGMANPNSWPRSVDLTAACCSMAVNEVEPDEELWKTMREILAGFDQGW